MINLLRINRQKLEDMIDKFIGFHHILGNVQLHEETIGDIYNIVVRDIKNAERSALKRYPLDPDTQTELSIEGQTFQKKKLLRNHGIALERLYIKAEPYMDNLPTLLLPNDATSKLNELMNHYKQLTNNKPGYTAMGK